MKDSLRSATRDRRPGTGTATNAGAGAGAGTGAGARVGAGTETEILLGADTDDRSTDGGAGSSESVMEADKFKTGAGDLGAAGTADRRIGDAA